MQSNDQATIFTLGYLELLERHLKVTWNEAGIPICLHDWVTDDALTSLRSDLASLMSGDTALAARKAASEYGDTHVQTVGFGLAHDFDQFIKLGLLYGERVVLWDVLSSRVLVTESYQTRKNLVVQIACELLMLKSLVRRGGAVILAHPSMWSQGAAEIDQAVRKYGTAPAASLGLALAFAAIADGLPLHPYTLLTDESRLPVEQQVLAAGHEQFSLDNLRFQQCLTSILQDTRFAYLEEADAEVFYDVLSRHDSVRREIRRHFLPALSGLSPQQYSQEERVLVDELSSLFEKRNADVAAYVADGIDASSTFIVASTSAALAGLPWISALGALGLPTVALSNMVRKWAEKPAKNVIIQAFRELEVSRAGSLIHDPVGVDYRLAVTQEGPRSLSDHYREFTRFYMTENRHDYLKSLSPEIAKEVLSQLKPDDIHNIVNKRQFQNDYIGDYLVDVFDLHKEVYWEHLTQCFDSPEGFLIYDDDAHIISMQQYDIPLSLWRGLLENLFTTYWSELDSGNYNFPLIEFPSVLHFQTAHAEDRENKRAWLLEIVREASAEQGDALSRFVSEAYDGLLPDWFVGAGNSS
ncbi:hypothetical protein M2262_003227 [Pseudomonas sp. BIGb0408]|uniref:Uncharacterized protein n=1 Tax=Phytopseudomonas flavescens TaxID=29435 RepID=A0A7Y9XJ88_9GAMM|nr:MULTISPECIES: hypothetical protein [Pseudomonas]MCW2293177.1 hypothetical protein [Pseudomonas sp. BIGb0408]NYH72252.1 hypothetical protein [Pseudomonas flavescens]